MSYRARGCAADTLTSTIALSTRAAAMSVLAGARLFACTVTRLVRTSRYRNRAAMASPPPGAGGEERVGGGAALRLHRLPVGPYVDVPARRVQGLAGHGSVQPHLGGLQ